MQEYYDDDLGIRKLVKTTETVDHLSFTIENGEKSGRYLCDRDKTDKVKQMWYILYWKNILP